MKNNYRVWTGREMFHFTLADLMGGVIEIPDYEGEEMQYTGLKDSEGNQIYEGDILEKEGLVRKLTNVVFYDDFEGAYLAKPLSKEWYVTSEGVEFADWKIVGNIYENKEGE